MRIDSSGHFWFLIPIVIETVAVIAAAIQEYGPEILETAEKFLPEEEEAVWATERGSQLIEEDIEAETRFVPNPNGRNGCQAHQDTRNSIKPSNGGQIDKEVKFDTTGGYKNSRFADAVERGRDGEITAIHQVGRINQTGMPVMRESRAIEDIMNSENYNGAPIFFWPYNSPGSGPIIFTP